MIVLYLETYIFVAICQPPFYKIVLFFKIIRSCHIFRNKTMEL